MPSDPLTCVFSPMGTCLGGGARDVDRNLCPAHEAAEQRVLTSGTSLRNISMTCTLSTQLPALPCWLLALHEQGLLRCRRSHLASEQQSCKKDVSRLQSFGDAVSRPPPFPVFSSKRVLLFFWIWVMLGDPGTHFCLHPMLTVSPWWRLPLDGVGDRLRSGIETL